MSLPRTSTDVRADVVAALKRIDPALGAFITVDPDASLAAANRAPDGPLRGVTIAVKDLIEVAGTRTTYGSPRYADHRPARTAPAVAALQAAGAVVVGKTNLNEFAFGVSGHNPHYGTIHCPTDPERTAGGSSGGSAAAVAMGACRIAVGTDTSGSVRIPAACCDVWGYKYGHGEADMAGIYPLAPSFDALGYLSAHPADLERVLRIESPADTHSITVAEADEDVELPPLPDEHWTLFRSEAWAVHGTAVTADPESYGADLRRKLALPRGDVRSARRAVEAWRRSYLTAAAPFDVILERVFDGSAPLVADVLSDYWNDRSTESDRLLARTPVANALGWPALVFPSSRGPRQVSGPPGSEPALFAVARQRWSAD